MKQRYFEDFQVGERYTGRPHTISDGDFASFAALTGDSHPIHYDEEYAAAHPFGRRVAHGLLLTALTAVGATELSESLLESMLAFVSQSTRFKKPVFIGDTVTLGLEVVELIPKGGRGVVKLRVALVDETGDELLDGEHVYLIRRRP